ncbi:proprotein convertase P-domain-containing protein [Ectopseudomonas mendocina]|uniref:Proprotein convertase P-domain-containing protein n=1 Tax=Ectopseudomonas mendocina TaxID=300 RepID=A0ABZ2RGW6_ECTME
MLLNLDHERVTDLLIELVSPSGTRSVLLNPFNGFVGQSIARELGGTPQSGMRNLRVLSNKFYGEESAGQWKLLITDVTSATRQFIREEIKDGKLLSTRVFTEVNNTKDGKLIDWSLRVFGH